MKRFFVSLLCWLCVGAMAGPNDIGLQQRNSADTGFVTRLLATPDAGANGLLYFNGSTVLPGYLALGTNLGITSGVLNVTGMTAGQVNSDWTASSGVSQILNKPTLASVATSGAYASLTGTPTLATVATTGAYADLTGKPTIPAAQVNSDWNAVSGLAQVLNKPSLATVATSGSYNDLTNKPAAPSQAANARAVNTGFQISTTRNALVFYSVAITVTASIAGGQSGDVILEIASDSGFTANVQTVAITGNSQTYTLAVALQGVQIQTGDLSGFVPAGYYTRLRTVNNTGTPTYSVRAGQEVQL